MTKRDGDGDDEDELDLDLDLEFEESVGEPRPMSTPSGTDPADGPKAGRAAGDGGNDDTLEIAGDLLAETGEELLDSLASAGDDAGADDELMELETEASGLFDDTEGPRSGPDVLLEPFGDDPTAGASTAAGPAPAVEPRATGGAAASATAAARGVQAGSGAGSEAGAGSGDGAELEGQWVWQFASPPPPPPFSAAFFSGRALPELYWFFASGTLVLLGCLLPWGPSLAWVVERGESTLGYTSPPSGYELPAGAICLALALWLLASASYGIYTGRQKILPVFMMLLPAWMSWSRTLAAWGELDGVDGLGFKDSIARLFEVAGTGVLLTMVGSTIVAAQLLVVILKVMKKQPPADGGRARKTGDKQAAEKKERDRRGGDKQERDRAKAAEKAARRGKGPATAGPAAADAPAGDAPSAGEADAGAAPSGGETDAGGGKRARGKRGRGR